MTAYASQVLYQTLQLPKINFEKTARLTSYHKPYCNPLKPS